jgi:hypothetical protein
VSPVPKTESLESSPPLRVFRQAQEAFEADHKALLARLASVERVRFANRYRLGASGAAVIAFFGPLVAAHCEAIEASEQSIALLEQFHFVSPAEPLETAEQLGRWTQERMSAAQDFQARTGRTWQEVMREAMDAPLLPTATLHAVYQALFYLLRAYQDRAYSVCLELLGDNSGPKVSMSKVVAPSGEFRVETKIGSFLAKRCPEYGVWFARFKKMRDDLKFGAPVATCGPQWDIGISIGVLDEAARGTVTDCSSGFRLGDVAHALDRTRGLLAALSSLCPVRAT